MQVNSIHQISKRNKAIMVVSVLINKETKLIKKFMVSIKYSKFLLMMENIKCGINLWYNYVDQFNCLEKKTSNGSGTLILVRALKFC